MDLITKLVIKHEIKKMKTTFGTSQIFQQNEPKIIHLIGTIALMCAIVAGIPLTLQQAGVTSIPPIIITVSTYAASIGAVVKMISKAFGTVDAQGNPVSTLPPATK
jgi:hypothetical protein